MLKPNRTIVARKVSPKMLAQRREDGSSRLKVTTSFIEVGTQEAAVALIRNRGNSIVFPLNGRNATSAQKDKAVIDRLSTTFRSFGIQTTTTNVSQLDEVRVGDAIVVPGLEANTGWSVTIIDGIEEVTERELEKLGLLTEQEA